jgi:hypothetical protein
VTDTDELCGERGEEVVVLLHALGRDGAGETKVHELGMNMGPPLSGVGTVAMGDEGVDGGSRPEVLDVVVDLLRDGEEEGGSSRALLALVRA